MHTTTPRIAPIPTDEFTPEQMRLANPGTGREFLNIVRTMVNHPSLYGTFIPFSEQLVFHSEVPLREREILILKTIAVCGGHYEAPMHDHVAANIGLSEAEVAAARGDGAGLSPLEQALVRAADELVRSHFVSDATWSVLAQHYSAQQLMEVVFLVGNYSMLVMATNSFGVQPEENIADKWKPF